MLSSDNAIIPLHPTDALPVTAREHTRQLEQQQQQQQSHNGGGLGLASRTAAILSGGEMPSGEGSNDSCDAEEMGGRAPTMPPLRPTTSSTPPSASEAFPLSATLRPNAAADPSVAVSSTEANRHCTTAGGDPFGPCGEAGSEAEEGMIDRAQPPAVGYMDAALSPLEGLSDEMAPYQLFSGEFEEAVAAQRARDREAVAQRLGNAPAAGAGAAAGGGPISSAGAYKLSAAWEDAFRQRTNLSVRCLISHDRVLCPIDIEDYPELQDAIVAAQYRNAAEGLVSSVAEDDDCDAETTADGNAEEGGGEASAAGQGTRRRGASTNAGGSDEEEVSMGVRWAPKSQSLRTIPPPSPPTRPLRTLDADGVPVVPSALGAARYLKCYLVVPRVPSEGSGNGGKDEGGGHSSCDSEADTFELPSPAEGRSRAGSQQPNPNGPSNRGLSRGVSPHWQGGVATSRSATPSLSPTPFSPTADADPSATSRSHSQQQQHHTHHPHLNSYGVESRESKRERKRSSAAKHDDRWDIDLLKRLKKVSATSNKRTGGIFHSLIRFPMPMAYPSLHVVEMSVDARRAPVPKGGGSAHPSPTHPSAAANPQQQQDSATDGDANADSDGTTLTLTTTSADGGLECGGSVPLTLATTVPAAANHVSSWAFGSSAPPPAASTAPLGPGHYLSLPRAPHCLDDYKGQFFSGWPTIPMWSLKPQRQSPAAAASANYFSYTGGLALGGFAEEMGHAYHQAHFAGFDDHGDVVLGGDPLAALSAVARFGSAVGAGGEGGGVPYHHAASAAAAAATPSHQADRSIDDFIVALPRSYAAITNAGIGKGEVSTMKDTKRGEARLHDKVILRICEFLQGEPPGAGYKASERSLVLRTLPSREVRAIRATCRRFDYIISLQYGLDRVAPLKANGGGEQLISAGTSRCSHNALQRLQLCFGVARISKIPLLLAWVFEHIGALPSPFPFLAALPTDMGSRPHPQLIPLYYVPRSVPVRGEEMLCAGPGGASRIAVVVLDTNDGQIKRLGAYSRKVLPDGRVSISMAVSPVVGVSLRPSKYATAVAANHFAEYLRQQALLARAQFLLSAPAGAGVGGVGGGGMFSGGPSSSMGGSSGGSFTSVGAGAGIGAASPPNSLSPSRLRAPAPVPAADVASAPTPASAAVGGIANLSASGSGGGAGGVGLWGRVTTADMHRAFSNSSAASSYSKGLLHGSSRAGSGAYGSSSPPTSVVAGPQRVGLAEAATPSTAATPATITTTATTNTTTTTGTANTNSGGTKESHSSGSHHKAVGGGPTTNHHHHHPSSSMAAHTHSHRPINNNAPFSAKKGMGARVLSTLDLAAASTNMRRERLLGAATTPSSMGGLSYGVDDSYPDNTYGEETRGGATVSDDTTTPTTGAGLLLAPPSAAGSEQQQQQHGEGASPSPDALGESASPPTLIGIGIAAAAAAAPSAAAPASATTADAAKNLTTPTGRHPLTNIGMGPGGALVSGHFKIGLTEDGAAGVAGGLMTPASSPAANPSARPGIGADAARGAVSTSASEAASVFLKHSSVGSACSAVTVSRSRRLSSASPPSVAAAASHEAHSRAVLSAAEGGARTLVTASYETDPLRSCGPLPAAATLGAALGAASHGLVGSATGGPAAVMGAVGSLSQRLLPPLPPMSDMALPLVEFAFIDKSNHVVATVAAAPRGGGIATANESVAAASSVSAQASSVSAAPHQRRTPSAEARLADAPTAATTSYAPPMPNSRGAPVKAPSVSSPSLSAAASLGTLPSQASLAPHAAASTSGALPPLAPSVQQQSPFGGQAPWTINSLLSWLQECSEQSKMRLFGFNKLWFGLFFPDVFNELCPMHRGQLLPIVMGRQPSSNPSSAAQPQLPHLQQPHGQQLSGGGLTFDVAAAVRRCMVPCGNPNCTIGTLLAQWNTE